MYRNSVKRLLDVLIAIFLLLMVLPLILILGIAILFTTENGILFSQDRAGMFGKTFTLFKLKTMRDLRDAEGTFLPDSERLTAIGRFLRTTSLDELPQLINVIKGDMSLIGPRPLLVRYLPLYSERQARRHEVRPGITGWAQVNGRNAISWEDRFELDVYYVDHLSIRLDLKILWMTILKVLKREGISGADSPTMKAFTGTPSSTHNTK